MQIVFSYFFSLSRLNYNRKSAEYTECLKHWELLQNKIVIVSLMDAHNCVSFKIIKYLKYVSCLGFPIEIFARKSCNNWAKIFYVSIQTCTKFRYNFVLMCKGYSAQILKKILVFAHLLIHAISLFRAISLNFGKQLQEMNESKIKSEPH